MRQAHPAESPAAGESRPPDPPPTSAAPAGILLTNLGTPDAPTARAVRRYLGEFLWDPRVVEVPRPLWWLVLHGAILPARSGRSARAYRRVWSEAGSPLLSHSRRQAAALQRLFDARRPGEVRVVLAMRYGNPSIAAGLGEMDRAGIRRVLVFPLYPQYSATTTASTFDAVATALRRTRHIPEIRFVADYHDDPGYVAALADSVAAARSEEAPPPRLLMSFHGLPERCVEAGDPYRAQCERTARLVAARLGLADEQWSIGFQSRFGRQRWLQPYTGELLRAWARGGVRRADVICPGFPADCLETLGEIAVEYRDRFLAAGGHAFRYIPALNDTGPHVEALARIALRHTRDWPILPWSD